MKYLGAPQSGSQANTTASHNRAGQYYRNRRSPVQPVGTGRRAFIRNVFGTASAGWATITAAQQAAWDSFAAGHPITDSLGQSLVLTGQQMYVRVNASLLNVAGAGTAVPPADLSLADLSPTTCVFSIAGGITFDNWTFVNPGTIAVAVSRPVSPGIRFMKTFWQPLGADGYVANAAAPKVITTAVYGAQFGAPVVGQKVFARLTPVSDDGWNGTPTIISTLVVV